MTRHQLFSALFLSVLAALGGSARQNPPGGTQAPEKSADKPPAQSGTSKPAAAKVQPGKKEAAKKPARKRVVADLSGFDLLAPGKQPMVVGATRELPRPVALAPRLAKLYSDGPWFAWDYQGVPTNFTFRMKNAARQEVFSAAVVMPSLHYVSGQNAPALEAGRTYFWTVEVASPLGGAVVSTPVGFLVVSSAEKEEIAKELPASNEPDSCAALSALAPVWTKHRLWYEAVRAYDDLIACSPDRADYFEQRGMIYAQLDVTRKLADQDFARADELRAGKKARD
jgi:hypothetical protein